MSKKKNAEEYSDEETKRRFEAALRGAREVGHESMKDISPKASKRKGESAEKARTTAKEELPIFIEDAISLDR